jgi:hypothetical protein
METTAMSDTTTREHDARQAAATEPSQTEPETSPETTTETAPPPGTEQTPPADAKPERTKEELAERALRRTFIEARETERKLRLVQEQLDRLQPPREPGAPPTQAEFDRAVQERAEAVVQQRQQAEATQTWVAAGNAAYPDFTERCNELASMGAAENPAFMAAIGRVESGHKVIAELAADPAETARILKLPAVDLAIAVATIAHRIGTAPPPPPRPTTQAPPPIRPLATAARAEVNLSNLDGAAFRSAFLKQFNGPR